MSDYLAMWRELIGDYSKIVDTLRRLIETGGMTLAGSAVRGNVPAASLRETSLAKVASITGINAKSVATTVLFAVPTGKTFIPLMVVIRVTAFTVGSKSVQAVASFGGNSATYDDFLNSITYTVAAVDTFLADYAADASALAVQAAGDSFRISIETGSDATTETWAVDVFGYLV